MDKSVANLTSLTQSMTVTKIERSEKLVATSASRMSEAEAACCSGLGDKFKLAPGCPRVAEKYTLFKESVTNKARHVLVDLIPEKIVALTARMEELAMKDYLCMDDLRQSDSETDPANIFETIVLLQQEVQAEASGMLSAVNAVKLWIQLNVPRIEDGDNFGVAIQEEVIGHLSKLETSAYNLCDGVKYHTARGKMASKIMKYPLCRDYKEAVWQIDKKAWLNLKSALLDLRNGYALIYELIRKNWEKVANPRQRDSHRLFN